MTVLFTALSFSSCEDDDPAKMIWEFSDYDKAEVTAAFAPEYYQAVQILANYDYTGTITLKCTNYDNLSIEGANSEGAIVNVECGFKVVQVDATTLKVEFTPIARPGETEVSAMVLVDGKNTKESQSTTMLIQRVANEEK